MKAQVAFCKDFMEAYSRLQKPQQKKVREFTEKFQRDPTQPGINFERIEGAIDSKVRSVRIDQTYRAIVVHPPRGDVFLCVWVDHHDDAYRWVRNKRFEVNPKSGVFQLYGVVEPSPGKAEMEAAPEATPPARDLLADYDDEDLLFAGVPAPLLAAVRALRSEEELDALAPHLPAEAAEMLYLFAAGYDLLEALEELERSARPPEKVDPEDFGAALARDDSRRTFKIVGDERELEEMLDAPFEQWRIFLHPTQRKLVEMNANGPIRALGGAGTGKTVALMHRAKHLARNVFDGPDDRLLVTTYTRNLALDLHANLQNLCGEELSRLEVKNLHSWAVGFMRRHGHSFRVVNDDADRRRQMALAVEESMSDDFTLDFLLEEWDGVVQDQEVDSRDDYLTARRVGRGRRLGRLQKARIWKIFERYRELLTQHGWVEWPDVLRETRLYIENQKISTPYRAVLADEVQDFTATALRLLRALAPRGPNTLFVVGDAHQRIYGHPICLSHCGIEIRGRSRRLKLNYRTTAEIRRHAVAILEGCEIDDLDGEADTLNGYCSLRRGPNPELRHFLKEAQEASFLVERVQGWLKEVPESAICVAARTKNKITDRYRPILESAGIRTVMVEKDPEAEAKKPGVRLATMHRLKGLEFPRVILPGVQEGSLPLAASYRSADRTSSEDHLLQERCLFYVASTRARDELVIIGYGSPSPFLVEAPRIR